MFKIVKSLFGGKENATPGAAAAPASPASASVAPAPVPAPSKTAAPVKAAAKAKPPVPEKVAPPEEICGITSGMSKEDIRKRLALLYKRYNRATSSLDAGLRAEAEKTLDAVVAVREKTFGPI